MSIGFGFLMIAVLVPGAGWGSGVCLALAAGAQVVGVKLSAWTVVAASLAGVAIALGAQSASQAAVAGMAGVISVVARFAPVLPDWPDLRRILVALGAGSAIGVVAATIPIGARWLALVAPVLVVLLVAAVLAQVSRSNGQSHDDAIVEVKPNGTFL
ncbi:hypothetical protein [Smaragdicoccus niigatensis]|uniref:hypothetical protein n=1 Tax=Smaragdicoccus niigatensis TaxID=359359 RepID=UPI00035CC9CB|nr:hypothetical protein [Smaragdicoccus niigatensis]